MVVVGKGGLEWESTPGHLETMVLFLLHHLYELHKRHIFTVCTGMNMFACDIILFAVVIMMMLLMMIQHLFCDTLHV